MRVDHWKGLSVGGVVRLRLIEEFHEAEERCWLSNASGVDSPISCIFCFCFTSLAVSQAGLAPISSSFRGVNTA